MLRLLADSCIWLDLVKDYRREPVLSAVEDLVKGGLVSLVVPRVVIDEFARNKDRVVKEGLQGIATVLKRARDVVAQFGTDAGKPAALVELGDVDMRMSRNGEDMVGAVARMERLFAGANLVETTADLKARGADRALAGRSPFHHKGKNGMGDAILIEAYADLVAAERDAGDTFAFVTVNHTDFSLPGGDHRIPHPDIAALFDGARSTFTIDLVTVLKAHHPSYFDEREAIEEIGAEEPRLASEIAGAINEYCEKVWYNRHKVRCERVADGRIRIVDRVEHKLGEPYPRGMIVREIWDGALKAAAAVESDYPGELGPWTDFEWGMVNGKLSALRWALGDEWDNLDT